MLPIEWREKVGLSQAVVAKCLGFSGKNPARTWSRYERGERQPDVEVIVAVEKLSRGKVTAQSWVQARESARSRVADDAGASR